MDVSMEIGGKTYRISKEIDKMDRLVLTSSEILEKLEIKYVIVSGYVAILFGRSRISEDIDIIIEKISYRKFRELWNNLNKKFWCIITSDINSAYNEYFSLGYALRFAQKNNIIPNIEIKIPKTSLEKWVLDNSLIVRIDEKILKISNIEIQIAFKLYLGSEKDIEDAKYLYEIFRENLNTEILNKFISMLGVEELGRRYLK